MTVCGCNCGCRQGYSGAGQTCPECLFGGHMETIPEWNWALFFANLVIVMAVLVMLFWLIARAAGQR
jgi:hypothetical protein